MTPIDESFRPMPERSSGATPERRQGPPNPENGVLQLACAPRLLTGLSPAGRLDGTNDRPDNERINDMEVKVKQTQTWKYDELPEDVKDKAVENLYDINVDSGYWYDYDGKTGFSKQEISKYHLQGLETTDLLAYKALYFDLDRGAYIQFKDAEFTDNELARRFLGVPRDLWEQVYWTINDMPGRNSNTRLEYEKQDNGEFTAKQTEILDRAVERFADKIDEALSGLRKNFKYLTSREAIEETVRANDYDFDERGKIYS